MFRETERSGKVMKLVGFILLSLLVTTQAYKLIYSQSYNLGLRDAAYSMKRYENSLVLVGPSTSPILNGTGTDFFALRVHFNNGSRMEDFGNNGVVRIDFDNAAGSRTDVATEVLVLVHLPYITHNEDRIIIIGESVVGPPPANLTFAAAMLYINGSIAPEFGTEGKALWDIESGTNDEAFFADFDKEKNIIMGGFANPTNTSGANQPFNCALLKVNNRDGKRITSFGTNGVVIIDHNGWDERCRSGVTVGNSFYVGGRAKPTSTDTNFRATLDKVDLDTGMFDASFGGYEYGFGRSVINGGNGSLDIIKTIVAKRQGGAIYSVGNWGGWDEGKSGRKAIILMKYAQNGGLDRNWMSGGISYILPPLNRSFDTYSMIEDARTGAIYVVGGLKLTAASSSPAVPFIANFATKTVYYPLVRNGSISSFYRSVYIWQDQAFPTYILVAGEVTYNTTSDVLLEKILL